MSPPSSPLAWRAHKASWFTFSRRELIFVFSLFALLLFIFQSQVSIRYNKPLTDAEWRPSFEMAPAHRPAPNDTGEILPSIYQELGIGLTVNDVRIEWGPNHPMPQTKLIRHAEGFNILDNLYMLNGTIFIVTNSPKDFPEPRLITSTGYMIFNGEEDVHRREPTDKDMRIVSVNEARKLFGYAAHRLEGVTFLENDPPQFINHYYHFSAEMFFGMWRTYSSLDPGIRYSGQTTLPPPRRMIFTHTAEDRWRDYAKMNQFVFHAAFPSAAMEFSEDWKDRSETFQPWFFDRVLFADRASAMRSAPFIATERFASSAFQLQSSANWFEPVRNNILEFAGGSRRAGASTRTKPVITYVSRQGWGRRMLKPADHEGLVKALRRLEKERGYEVNIVEMDKLTRAEQFQLVGRSTILMGVHGNGLTALLWMFPTPRTTVMEFFYPGGFAFDYEWTARALGIKHFGFWGNTYWSSPDLPPKAYPDGFQGNDIPIDGEVVARLCIQQLTLEDEADD